MNTATVCPSASAVRRTTCRLCGSSALTDLFTLGSQHVSDFVPADRVTAGPKVPIELVLCQCCQLVQQRYTAPADLLYSRHYWYRSGVTRTMRDSLWELALAVGNAVELNHGDVWLDIGANDGTLLSNVYSGVCRVGVEPAENMSEGMKHASVWIRDFWSYETYAETLRTNGKTTKAKVVTAIGMLYDLEDPVKFVSDVAKVLHRDGVFVAQLMCLKQTLKNYDVGNLCHEHLEFYSLQSLRALYAAAGLEIFRVEENKVNGGSYRVWARLLRSRAGYDGDCHPSVPFFLREELDLRLDKPETYTEWYYDITWEKDRLVDFLRGATTSGKRVWAFGASTKGNVLLQWWGFTRGDLGAVVDRSPEKHGLWTAGSGVPIVHEDQAKDFLPDYMLVLPYAFVDEFVAREADRAWRKAGGKFIIPLPAMRVL